MNQIVERDQVYRDTRRELLSVLWQELTPEERFLVEWRIVDRWDYEHIATRLGVPRADLVKRMRGPGPSFGGKQGRSKPKLRPKEAVPTFRVGLVGKLVRRKEGVMD